MDTRAGSTSLIGVSSQVTCHEWQNLGSLTAPTGQTGCSSGKPIPRVFDAVIFSVVWFLCADGVNDCV